MGLTLREKKLLSQFANNNYGLYNKTLAKKLGLHESIFLGEIISEYDYWSKRGELTDDGYFYSTLENVTEATTLSDYQQRSIVKHLIQLRIIDMKIAGMPAKRYFKINEENLYSVLIEEDIPEAVESLNLTELTASSKESKEQDPNLVGTNNNNIKLTNNNNNNIVSVPFINTEKKSNLLEEAGEKSCNSSKKKSNKEQCIDATYEIIQDYELAEYINSYLIDQQLYKSINSTQWKMRLENIIKYAHGNRDLAKEIVKQTWKRGYRDFYPVATSQVQNTPAYTNITRTNIVNETPKVDEGVVF